MCCKHLQSPQIAQDSLTQDKTVVPGTELRKNKSPQTQNRAEMDWEGKERQPYSFTTKFNWRIAGQNNQPQTPLQQKLLIPSAAEQKTEELLAAFPTTDKLWVWTLFLIVICSIFKEFNPAQHHSWDKPAPFQVLKRRLQQNGTAICNFLSIKLWVMWGQRTYFSRLIEGLECFAF